MPRPRGATRGVYRTVHAPSELQPVRGAASTSGIHFRAVAELTQERRDVASSPEDGNGLHLLTCYRCGSHRIHRSHPKNSLESVLRSVTPLRFHRCSECGHRGYHLAWSAPRAAHQEAAIPSVPTDPRRSYRDTLAARVRRRRIIRSILVATVLGVLVSVVALTR